MTRQPPMLALGTTSNAAMPRDDGLSPRQKLRYRLAAIRSEQSGDGWDGLPLGGDLRGPRRSTGYPALVAAALGYAWTWQGRVRFASFAAGFCACFAELEGVQDVPR